ncbi:putative lipid II flippase FtsW [Candidatus Parcubacteria bacterium]|nr:putative lipid II flippase FtsW [Candidatus Parcubacteria bacterium]
MIGQRKRGDYLLIGLVAALIGYGLLVLASASAVVSQDRFGTPYFFLRRQLISLGIGIVLFLVLQRIPYASLRRYAPLFLVLSVLLLILVFVPQIGFSSGGASRWLQFGWGDYRFTIQPAEVVKLTFILYLAAWLEAKREEVRRFSEGVMPFAIVLGILALLILLQPDVGTLVIIAVVGVVMYGVSGARLRHLGVLGAVGLAAFLAAVRLAPYRISRLLSYFNPGSDPQGIGYHISQSLIAIGSGGIWGRGLGHSVQKFSYLPEPMGDSIAAILAEELGFVGVAALLTLFGLLILRGFFIAKRAPDRFGRFLASGIVTWLGLQAFVNLGAVSGLVPFTGIPLPFVSYGGSSLVTALAGVGILVSISKHTQA